MLGFFKKLLFGAPETTKETALSPEQAIAIAQTADIDPIYKRDLRLADTVEKDGRVLWCVSSISKGAQELVFIDDNTGKIVETKHVGIR